MDIDPPEKRKQSDEDDKPAKRIKPLSSRDVSNMARVLCKELSTMTGKYELIQKNSDITTENEDLVIRYEAMFETLWNLYMNYGPPMQITVNGTVRTITDPEKKKNLWNIMMSQDTFRPNRQNWTRLCTEMEQYFYFFEMLPPEINDQILGYFRPMSKTTKSLSEVSNHLKAIIDAREAWIPYCVNLASNVSAALVQLGKVDLIFGGWLIKITITRTGADEELYRVIIAYPKQVFPQSEKSLQINMLIVRNARKILGKIARDRSHDEIKKIIWGKVSSDKMFRVLQSVWTDATTIGAHHKHYIISRKKYVVTQANGEKQYLLNHFKNFFSFKEQTLNPNLFETGIKSKYSAELNRMGSDEKSIHTVFGYCSWITLNSLVTEVLSESGKNIWTRAYDVPPVQTREEEILFRSSLGWYNPDTGFVARRMHDRKISLKEITVENHIVIFQERTLNDKRETEDLADIFLGEDLPLGMTEEYRYLDYLQNPSAFL
jgi:hypothetical protein